MKYALYKSNRVVKGVEDTNCKLYLNDLEKISVKDLEEATGLDLKKDKELLLSKDSKDNLCFELDDQPCDIVFTDLKITDSFNDECLSGAVIKGDVSFDQNTVLNGELIVCGSATIKKGVTVMCGEKKTLRAEKLNIEGTFMGSAVADVYGTEGGAFIGALVNSNLTVQGDFTFSGMMMLGKICVRQDSHLLLKNGGGAMDELYLEDNSVYEICDFEPLVVVMDMTRMYMDYDHGENGVLRPTVADNGHTFIGNNVILQATQGSKENYIHFGHTQGEFENVFGRIFAFSNDRYYGNKEDLENVKVSELKFVKEDEKRKYYEITLKYLDPEHVYNTSKETTYQAALWPIMNEAFNGMFGRFDSGCWFGFEDFRVAEHWHGPNDLHQIEVKITEE